MMVKLYDMFPLGNVIVFRNIHDNTLKMLNECFNCHLESLLAHILSKNSLKKCYKLPIYSVHYLNWVNDRHYIQGQFIVGQLHNTNIIKLNILEFWWFFKEMHPFDQFCIGKICKLVSSERVKKEDQKS